MARVKEIEGASVRELTLLSSIIHFYEIPPEGFLVAEERGKVLGFIVTNVRSSPGGGQEGHILSIAVDPAYRERGIGSRLITATTNWLRNQSVKNLVLEVKASNRGAIHFYKRQGFRESHIIERYYRNRGYAEDALVMNKGL